MRIEQVLTKQRILELYLNEIYLGQGAYGVAAAAQAYFNKPLDELTLARGRVPRRAAQGAATTTTRSAIPMPARARRDWVLDRMAEDHAITRAEADAAKAEPLVPSEFRGPTPIPGADWFAEEVRAQLIAAVRRADVTRRRAVGPHQPEPDPADRGREGGARRPDGI